MAVKDYLSRELQEGDLVVFIETGYRWFSTGRILKVNPKKVTVRVREGVTTQRFGHEVIRI